MLNLKKKVWWLFAVIMNVLTHEGFDDQGRQYDSKGNFQPLWPEEIINNFETRTQCIIGKPFNSIWKWNLKVLHFFFM